MEGRLTEKRVQWNMTAMQSLRYSKPQGLRNRPGFNSISAPRPVVSSKGMRAHVEHHSDGQFRASELMVGHRLTDQPTIFSCLEELSYLALVKNKLLPTFLYKIFQDYNF